MLGPMNPVKFVGNVTQLKGSNNSFKNKAKESFLNLKMFALSREEYERKPLQSKGTRLQGKGIQDIAKRTERVAEKTETFVLRSSRDLDRVRARLGAAIAQEEQIAALAVADKLGKGLLLLHGCKTKEEIPRFLREIDQHDLSATDRGLILNHIKVTYGENLLKELER